MFSATSFHSHAQRLLGPTNSIDAKEIPLNPAAPISTADLEACLLGHADGVKAKVCVLLAEARGMKLREAVRRYSVTESALYQAKHALETKRLQRSVEALAIAKITNNNKPPVVVSGAAANSLQRSGQSDKTFEHLKRTMFL